MMRKGKDNIATYLSVGKGYVHQATNVRIRLCIFSSKSCEGLRKNRKKFLFECHLMYHSFRRRC